MTRYILLLGVLAAPWFAAASPLQCEVGSVVRCVCDASMTVRCQGLPQAYISNKAKARSITFIFKAADGTETEISVPNPAEAARSYYTTDPQKFPEVKAALERAGKTMGAGTSLRLKALQLDNANDLYEDSKASKKIQATPAFTSCSFISVVRKLSYQGEQKCASFIRCKEGTGTAICSLQAGLCPNAESCANDHSVDASEEEISRMLCYTLNAQSQLNPISACTPQGTVTTPSSSGSGSSQSGSGVN